MKSKFRHKLFKRQPSLLNDALERSGFDQLVLRNDDCAMIFAQDKVRPGLTKFDESKTF